MQMECSATNITALVTPAKAGVQCHNIRVKPPDLWIPACAGMTATIGFQRKQEFLIRSETTRCRPHRTRYSLANPGTPSVTIFSCSSRCSMCTKVDMAAAG